MGFGRGHSLSCKSFILFTPLYAGSVDALCRRRLCEPLKAFCCLFFLSDTLFRPPAHSSSAFIAFSRHAFLWLSVSSCVLPSHAPVSSLCAVLCVFISFSAPVSCAPVSSRVLVPSHALSIVHLPLFVHLSLLVRLSPAHLSLLMCCPFSCTRLFSSTSLLCLFSYCLCPFRHTSYSSCHRSYLLQHAYSS